MYMADKPYIIIFSTISVDGALSVKGRKYRLSSDRDLYRLHYLRSTVDAVMVGANTVMIDDPLLNVRIPGYKGKQPYRIVVDGKLKLSLNYKVFDTSIAPTIIITSNRNKYNEKINDLRKRGVRVLFVREHEKTKLNLAEAMEKLYEEYSIRKILVEGGGRLIASLLKNQLVDEIYLSISPLLIGLNKTSLIEDYYSSPLNLRLRKIYIDHVTGEIIVNYLPVYK